MTLPDIGKLSVTEKKKDDMDVDQEGSKKDSTGTKEPTPRGTEAGKTDPSEITNFKGATFEEYRKNAPDYEYSGEGDDRRILPKNTPIDMEKSLPAEVALLIPRAVATQKEAEEAERAALEAIRGDYRLPDVGQEDREKVDPYTVTDEDLAASVDALTRRLSNMPEWSGNMIDPVKSAELIAARWGGKASYDKPEAPLTEAGMKSASLEDRAYALSQLNQMVNFHKKHLCSGRGAPLVSAAAPSGPFAPDQLDDSRKFRPSGAASKMTYNLVILDGKEDYLADRREINPELRETGVIPDEAITCQIVVPSKTRLGEYLPSYEETVGTVAGREAAKELMRLLSCDFDGLVINSKRVSELFEERVLKETGREAGNWVKSDQAIWFLKEISGMENAEMSWKFFIPTLKAFPIGQVEAMLMVMYDGDGVLLKESTRLVAVRHTRIGRDLSYSAVRHRYTQEDAPGGSLMYEMHWNELPMVGYVIMKFSDFRKAVQLQRVRRNGKAMIEILITRPDVYETIGDGRQDEGLIPLVGAMALAFVVCQGQAAELLR